MLRVWLLGIGCWLMLPLCAQTPPVEPLPTARNLSALKSIADPLSEAIAEVDRLNEQLANTTSEEQKGELTARLEAERERVKQLRRNFREIVGGAEAAAYEEKKEEERKTSIQEQLGEMLQPLVGALREPTNQLREMDELRQQRDEWLDRKAKVDRVLERIEQLEAEAVLPRVKTELATARRLWEGRHAEALGQVELYSVQVEEREQQTPTLWEAVSGMFKDFWKSRGLNVLLAIVMAVLAYIGVRRGYSWMRRVSPAHRKGKLSLVGRVSDIFAIGLAIFCAIVAVLLVFYLRGDWLLLTLAAVLLLSALWAGKNALPPYIDQIRMMLNLGPVREGERIIYQDLPWQVKSLGFYTTFSNPALEGGELRIPLKNVMGMISREADPKEPWFPTMKEDWVVMGDGTFGKVLRQTPEQVVLLRRGGALRTYLVEEFLELVPENLSRGFRARTTFGIDYSLQAIATTEVTEIFTRRMHEALVAEFGHEPVRSVKVELKNAGASSLDYEVLADFDGELAPRYNFIRRMLQRVCVEVCNEEGWVIPFTQLTVHQALAPE